MALMTVTALTSSTLLLIALIIIYVLLGRLDTLTNRVINVTEELLDLIEEIQMDSFFSGSSDDDDPSTPAITH